MSGRVFNFKGKEAKPIVLRRGPALRRDGRAGVVLGSQLYATMPTFRLLRLRRLGVDPDWDSSVLIARLRNQLIVQHFERSALPERWDNGSEQRYQMTLQALRGEQLVRDRERTRGAMPWRPDLWS